MNDAQTTDGSNLDGQSLIHSHLGLSFVSSREMEDL